MSYEVEFRPTAMKAWKKLDSVTRQQFQKKLSERADHPRVPKDALHGRADHYKIKLKDRGYRLAYQVLDQKVVILVIAVGRRDEIYDAL